MRAWLCLFVFSAVPALAESAADASAGGGDLTHRMMRLMLQLGAIIFAARLGNMLFEKLRLPPVMGEICAGMLIGPYLLGALPLPAFPAGLFGAPAGAVGSIPISPELYGFNVMASVTLLFMVGLETDLKLFLRYSLAGGLTGIGGVVLSFLAGWGLAVWIAPVLRGAPVGPFDPTCLMLGVIFTATSVGIPSRILAEHRKIDSPEGVTILAGAVIDDVLGVILLAIVMGVIAVSGPDAAGGAPPWGTIGRIAFKAIAFWLGAMAIGLTASRRISMALKLFKARTIIAVMAFGLALIVAGIFEAAGLAMIVGAYVLGLSLSGTDLRHVILEKIQVLNILLVPVFFAVMGMMVDVRQFLSPVMVGFGVLFFLAALLSKLLGCGLPPMLAGFNLRGGFRIGAGMTPRGEVTLLMAGAGLTAGVLSPQLLGVVIIMTLLSALTAPPLMMLAFRSPLPGLRKPPPRSEDTELVFPFPSAAITSMLTEKLVSSFTTEGFFVHRLDRESGLYQLRKDTIAIGFRAQETEIVFSCSPRDVVFVRTAMTEVVAELEQTIRELRKPLDTHALQREIQPGTAGDAGGDSSPSHRVLREVLSPDLMCPRLRSDTRRGVIEELLDRINAGGFLHDRDAVLASILDREENFPTGLPQGLALPHARTPEVEHLVCAIGLKSEGVDFAAADGRPARIVVLILAPDRPGVPYLRFISNITQVLNDEGRRALLACDSARDMYAVLTGESLPGRTSFLGKVGKIRLRRRNGAPRPIEGLAVLHLRLGLEAETPEEVIGALLEACAADGGVRDVDKVRATVLERENVMSTAVGHGIALPHARTGEADRLVCALAVLARGVDFQAPDGEPVRIVALTLIPASDTMDYPRFIAGLTKRLDAEGRRILLSARTADEARRVLERPL